MPPKRVLRPKSVSCAAGRGEHRRDRHREHGPHAYAPPRRVAHPVAAGAPAAPAPCADSRPNLFCSQFRFVLTFMNGRSAPPPDLTQPPRAPPAAGVPCAAGRGHAGGGLEAHERCDDRHSYRKDGAYAGACGCLSRVWGDETRARGSSGTPRGSCPCRRCRCGRDDACDCVVARSEAESLCVDHVSNRSVAHMFNGKSGGL